LPRLYIYIYIYNKNGQGIFKIFFIISRLNISTSHKTSDMHWIDGFRKKYYFFRFSLKFNNKRIIISKSLGRLNQYLKGFVPYLVRYYHSQATYQIEIQYSGMSFFLYKNGVLCFFNCLRVYVGWRGKVLDGILPSFRTRNYCTFR